MKVLQLSLSPGHRCDGWLGFVAPFPMKDIDRDSRSTWVQLGCSATEIIRGHSSWRKHMQTNTHMRWHSAVLMQGFIF